MSPAELKCMARARKQLLVKAGLRSAWEEAVWCSSAPDILEATIVVDGTVITRRNATRKLLCDSKVAVRHRLRLLSSLYWCSGSWILTPSQWTHVLAVQENMLGRMIYVPRSRTETPEAHLIRWSKLLHNCRAKLKILHGDEMYFASYFSWCAHVAQLSKVDPQRVTSRIYTLKKMEWLGNLQNPMSWTSAQGVEMKAARCAVCWHRLDKCCTGSDSVEGQDGCDDQVEKTKKWLIEMPVPSNDDPSTQTAA